MKRKNNVEDSIVTDDLPLEKSLVDLDVEIRYMCMFILKPLRTVIGWQIMANDKLWLAFWSLTCDMNQEEILNKQWLPLNMRAKKTNKRKSMLTNCNDYYCYDIKICLKMCVGEKMFCNWLTCIKAICM